MPSIQWNNQNALLISWDCPFKYLNSQAALQKHVYTMESQNTLLILWDYPFKYLNYQAVLQKMPSKQWNHQNTL
jgi:hypothetical protein